MKDICFDNLTMEELENLCRDANNELTRRKNKSRKKIGTKWLPLSKLTLRSMNIQKLTTMES